MAPHLERVVRREMDVKKVDAPRVGAVRRAHDGRLPLEEIIAHRPRAAVRGGVLLQIRQLLLARRPRSARRL